MNIVVLLFLQCGTNHRDCFQSAYCESSIGHSAGYASDLSFSKGQSVSVRLNVAVCYHSAKNSQNVSAYLLTYPLCAKDDTRSLATKESTYDGRFQQPMPLSNIAVSLQFFFLFFRCSLGVFRCSLGFLAFFPQYLSPNQNSSDILSVIPLETRPIHFQRLPLFVLDSGIVAVFSYSCLFDILSGNCSSRFSEGIFDGTPQASHIFRWFSRVQSSKVTLPQC